MICNDIKNLDNARNNITTTISSLTKLIMLITGIEKLETFVTNKQYKEAANAIEASNDIMEYFKEYKHVTQVNALYLKKDALCNKLQSAILDEFASTIELLPNNSERLYEGCLAINAIGDSAVFELKSWFTQYKLKPYETVFDPKNEKAIEFSETERRFEWLKPTLKDYDRLYVDVFLPSWGIKSQLCQEFCRITKLQLNDVLMLNSEGVKKIDVEVLVKVLNSTVRFEENLHEYLLAEYPGNAGNENNNTKKINLTSGIEGRDVVGEIKMKYGIGNNENNAQSTFTRKDPNMCPKYRPFRVLRVISETFDPYMNSYVTKEIQKIKENIQTQKQNDRIEGQLYVSSLYLFNNIKQAMNRCLSISKGGPFLELCNKFKEVFKEYNQSILQSKVNVKSTTKIDVVEIKSIAYVINTSDYCISTIGSLTQSLQDKIEEEHKHKINYDDILDCFRTTYKTAYDILTSTLKNELCDTLKTSFLTSNWASDTLSTEISSFVIKIYKTIENYFINMKDILQEAFICHFLNTIPQLVVQILLMYLYKVKKINENGAQKMLMDITELKEMIINIYVVVVTLPEGQSKENDSGFVCLKMFVKKEFDKIENRLKCLGSVEEEIGNAYKNFVENKSKEDFEKLIMIRGIKKSDIVDYDKIFN